MSRRVNFDNETALNSIPEDEHDADRFSSEDESKSEFARSHSIHELVSAKNASRILRLKSIDAGKNKQRDEGLYEMTHADYPLIRDDMLLTRSKSIAGGSIRSGSALIEDAGQNSHINAAMKYNMMPLRRFKELEVEKIIRSVFDANLHNSLYDSELCRYKSRVFADLIKDRVKRLLLPRYKLICIVYMGQIGQQTMRVASRCSWDTRVDDFAEYLYRNNSLWALGTVYGLYYE